MLGFRTKTEDFCACNFQILRSIFVNPVHFFRKEKRQVYRCFALTLNDIRINCKITTNNEKIGIYCTAQALEG